MHFYDSLLLLFLVIFSLKTFFFLLFLEAVVPQLRHTRESTIEGNVQELSFTSRSTAHAIFPHNCFAQEPDGDAIWEFVLRNFTE